MSEEKAPVVRQQPPKRERLTVRSAWLFPINGEVLISASGAFRLMNVEKWPVRIKFEIYEDEFLALKKPEDLVEDEHLRENLWRAGIVRKGNPDETRVRQAIHLTKYSLEQVINLLKGNN